MLLPCQLDRLEEGLGWQDRLFVVDRAKAAAGESIPFRYSTGRHRECAGANDAGVVHDLKGKKVVAFDVDLEKRILRQTARQNGGRDFSLSWDSAGTYYTRFVAEMEESKKQYKPQTLTRIEKSAVGNCRATLGVIRMIARTPVVKTRVRLA